MQCVLYIMKSNVSSYVRVNRRKERQKRYIDRHKTYGPRSQKYSILLYYIVKGHNYNIKLHYSLSLLFLMHPKFCIFPPSLLSKYYILLYAILEYWIYNIHRYLLLNIGIKLRKMFFRITFNVTESKQWIIVLKMLLLSNL